MQTDHGTGEILWSEKNKSKKFRVGGERERIGTELYRAGLQCLRGYRG